MLPVEAYPRAFQSQSGTSSSTAVRLPRSIFRGLFLFNVGCRACLKRRAGARILGLVLPGMRVTRYTFVRVRILTTRLQKRTAFAFFQNDLWRKKPPCIAGLEQYRRTLLYPAVLSWLCCFDFRVSVFSVQSTCFPSNIMYFALNFNSCCC